MIIYLFSVCCVYKHIYVTNVNVTTTPQHDWKIHFVFVMINNGVTQKVLCFDQSNRPTQLNSARSCLRLDNFQNKETHQHKETATKKRAKPYICTSFKCPSWKQACNHRHKWNHQKNSADFCQIPELAMFWNTQWAGLKQGVCLWNRHVRSISYFTGLKLVLKRSCPV